MGRTACMDMVLEIENGEDPYGGGAINRQPVRAVLLCKCEIRREIWRKGGDRDSNKEATALQGGVSCELRGVQAFRHVRDDNFAYDVNRQVPIFESRS